MHVLLCYSSTQAYVHVYHAIALLRHMCMFYHAIALLRHNMCMFYYAIALLRHMCMFIML